MTFPLAHAFVNPPSATTHEPVARFRAAEPGEGAVEKLPARLRRTGLRQFAFLALCAFIAGAAPAHAATITVSEQSPGVGNVMDGEDQLCSLVGAITNANNNDQSGDTGCAAGSGADTIVLPTGATFTLTSTQFLDPLFGGTGLPRVTSAITIEGNGSTLRRSSAAGTPAFRILRIEGSSAALTLNKITVSGGSVSSAGGGGLLHRQGSLTLNQSTVSGNTAGNASGGGILSESTLTITNTPSPAIAQVQAQPQGRRFNPVAPRW